MVTRASQLNTSKLPQIEGLSPEAMRIDIVEGLRFGSLSHREAALRLGTTAVKAQEYSKQLKDELTEKTRERLENSIRKEERIYQLKLGADRVSKGERIDRVALELGTTTRTLYRYLETA